MHATGNLPLRLLPSAGRSSRTAPRPSLLTAAGRCDSRAVMRLAHDLARDDVADAARRGRVRRYKVALRDALRSAWSAGQARRPHRAGLGTGRASRRSLPRPVHGAGLHRPVRAQRMGVGMIGRRSLLRGAAALPFGVGAALPQSSRASAAEARLAAAVDRLDALQAHAGRHAAGAALDPADPYTVAMFEMDAVAAGMATSPADTMAGVLLKLRAMAVPIVGEDEDSPLPLSVCRDLRRMHAAGGLPHG
ncbi:MAG: hypothetical protein ACRYGP_10560 [Janthinobacterium lividum]